MPIVTSTGTNYTAQDQSRGPIGPASSVSTVTPVASVTTGTTTPSTTSSAPRTATGGGSVAPTSYTPTSNPVPTYGEQSASVATLQQQLNAKNANVPGYVPLAVDGKYGPLTQAAANFGTNGAPAATPQTPQQQQQSLSDQMDQAYQNFSNTMTQYANGSIPLTAGEQAQVDGLTQQYQALISQQQLTNTNATGIANIRGYQTGAAEYDPTFQAKTIGSIAAAGIQKIAALDTQQASAVAALTKSLQEGDESAIKDAYDAYTQYASQKASLLQSTITDTQNAIQFAQDQQEKIREFNDTYSLDVKKFNAENPGLVDLNTGLLKTGVINSNLPGVTKVPGSNLTYIDLSQVPAAQKASVEAVAESNGVPVIDSSQNKNLPELVQTLTGLQQLKATDGGDTKISDLAQGTPSTALFGIPGLLGAKTKADITKFFGSNAAELPDIKNLTVDQAIQYMNNNLSTTLGMTPLQMQFAPAKTAVNTALNAGYPVSQVVDQLASLPQYADFVKQARASGETDQAIAAYINNPQ